MIPTPEFHPCTCPPLRDLVAQGLAQTEITPCELHRPEQKSLAIDIGAMQRGLNGTPESTPALNTDGLTNSAPATLGGGETTTTT